MVVHSQYMDSVSTLVSTIIGLYGTCHNVPTYLCIHHRAEFSGYTHNKANKQTPYLSWVGFSIQGVFRSLGIIASPVSVELKYFIRSGQTTAIHMESVNTLNCVIKHICQAS